MWDVLYVFKEWKMLNSFMICWETWHLNVGGLALIWKFVFKILVMHNDECLIIRVYVCLSRLAGTWIFYVDKHTPILFMKGTKFAFIHILDTNYYVWKLFNLIVLFTQTGSLVHEVQTSMLQVCMKSINKHIVRCKIRKSRKH